MSEAPGAPSRDEPELLPSLRRWEWAGALLFVVLVAAFPIYRAVDAARRPDALEERTAALIASGGELWSANCGSCHGASGDGDSAPALNSKEFLENTTDEQMHSITAVGIPGTEMPLWWNELGGTLTDEQIAALVAFMRSWEPTAPSIPDFRSPVAEESDESVEGD